MGTAAINPFETLWCTPGEHHWERLRARGCKPARCPEHGGRRAPYATEHTGIQTSGELYLAALDIALTSSDPAERERAGVLMRELADEMRQPAPERPQGARFAPTNLRDAIVAALDHRIFGV